MDKVIKILREQMILCSRLSELFNGLDNALKDNSSGGANVTSSVQAIEPIMKDLSNNDIKIQEFLKSVKVSDLRTFVEKQPESIEHNVANGLLTQIGNLQKRLRHQITNVARLLVNSKTFIDYNVNVMTRAVASTTYGPPGSNMKNQGGRRIFDANV